MGYDLHMVRTPATVDADELPNSSGVAGYYRFNVRGMAMTVGALEWADVIHYGRAPAIPSFPPAGLEEVRAVALVDHLHAGADLEPAATEAEFEAVQGYLEACDAAVSGSSLVDGKVGAYKFQSNDGWLVTPEECVAIAAGLRRHGEVIAREFFTDAGISAEDGRRWVAGFARYNEIAAEHGGYRVN